MTTTLKQLTQVVNSTGLWDNGRSDGPHAFRLSPQPFAITGSDKAQIDKLSRAVHRALLGISRLLAIASDSSLRDGTGEYVELYRLLTRGSPYNLYTLRPANIPLLCKADLMVDRSGHVWIAELDATNPRSWGYSVLGRLLCQATEPDAQLFPGVVPYLAAHLRRNQAQELLFLYGHTQRFYEPEFQILAKALASQSITMHVRDEVQINGADLPIAPNAAGVTCLVDMPPMNQNKALIDGLTSAARQRQVEFIIPPKHPLSSKSLMAVISDPDGQFAHLLRSQIAQADLDLIRRHLPATCLVGKGYPVHPGLCGSPAVLKRSQASGMKGVWLSGDPAYKGALLAAQKQAPAHVLQEKVDQRPHSWAVYEADGSLSRHSDWYVRLTGYFSRAGCLDLAVTARRDPRVHGSSDAIITGTVVT